MEDVINYFKNNYAKHFENIKFYNKFFVNQKPELYYGNREYKRKIIECSQNKIIKRSTQMLFRLHEGYGRALYIIGINDNGTIHGLSYKELIITFQNFIKIVELTNCNIDKISIYYYDNNYIMTIRLSKKLNTIEI